MMLPTSQSALDETLNVNKLCIRRKILLRGMLASAIKIEHCPRFLFYCQYEHMHISTLQVAA